MAGNTWLLAAADHLTNMSVITPVIMEKCWLWYMYMPAKHNATTYREINLPWSQTTHL